MPNYTKLYHSLDADEDFNALSLGAQHLYLRLLASPTLTYAGVCDWRPPRMLSKWPGATVASIAEAADELARARFVFVDEPSEEALVRTYVRYDGLMKQKNMAVAMLRSFNAISSPSLRRICLWEIHELHREDPTLAGWPKVDALLTRTSIDPSVDPSIDPSVYPPIDRKPKGSVDPSVDHAATTTATTTTTSTRQNKADKSATRAKATVPPSGFEEFWDTYGHKIKKPAAIKAYRTALTKTDAGTLLEAAKAFIERERRRPDFPDYLPHASSWLNQERWSEPATPLPPAKLDPNRWLK